MAIWERVNSPSELKQLSKSELKEYAAEVRQHIIDVVNVRGGHLASSLGVVEMTLALHYAFTSPDDKIIWDVGHQSYAHKIITGRRDSFKDIRTNGGISGFPSPSESQHDSFFTGHSSTSLSVGLGFAHARKLLGGDYNIVSVIGDGALTGGMAFEALNDIGANGSKVIIILNDNKMSISRNVGAMSKYLTKLRLSSKYLNAKRNIKKGISALPIFGERLVKVVDRSKESIKSLLLFNKIFENLGIKYIGPIDGHNIDEMIEVFGHVKKDNGPVIVHLITNKGSGYEEAEQNPSKYHGINSAEDKIAIETNYSNVIGNFLTSACNKDSTVVAITAAMASGTGLSGFSEQCPDNYFDVAIAEQHAVTMAAGMAARGLKPYVAIYSTFLQRAFDQIIHDVALPNLPVRFLIDRAGVVGADGKTHQGIFDISYLNLIPNMTICTPKDGNDLNKLLEWSLSFPGPLAIRYPKSYTQSFSTATEISHAKWEQITKSSKKIYILAAGSRMLSIATEATQQSKTKENQAATTTANNETANNETANSTTANNTTPNSTTPSNTTPNSTTRSNANIIHARFIKPLDTEFLDSINKKGNLIITLEDNVKSGGFGEAVLSFLGSNRKCDIQILAHKNEFCDNREVQSALKASCLTAQAISKLINQHE